MSQVVYDTNVGRIGNIEMREGVTPQLASIPFKGCVLYLEGLGDSISNHIPLFSFLADNGYRVISFDYMGQGGSSGSMNDTTVNDYLGTGAQITTQAKFFWGRHEECAKRPRLVIGWSTGGLAAYSLANEGWANAVVLIAPGIVPKKFVGESAHWAWWEFPFRPVITLETLTRNRFVNQWNPHVDPIKPDSPLKVPWFALNLLSTAKAARSWKIPPTVAGLVFLSSNSDTYVDARKTAQVLRMNAPLFTVIQEQGALHEIDNELPTAANDLRSTAVKFFNLFASSPTARTD